MSDIKTRITIVGIAKRLFIKLVSRVLYGFFFSNVFQQTYAQIIRDIKKDTVITLQSSILHESYQLYVALPNGYKLSTDKYPIIYVLDAAYNFSFTAEAARLLYTNNRIPTCIVVGVVSTHRERDFTTPKNKDWNAPMDIPSGGADLFLSYLEKEVTPYIKRTYRAYEYSVLVGHSLAGVFALHAFSAKPSLFNAYITLDPAVWWNKGEVLHKAIAYLGTHPGIKAKLFWARDKIPHEVWFGENTEWLTFLTNSKPAGLEFTFLELDGETHSTLVFPGTYFGIRDIFSDYLFPFKENSDLASVEQYYRNLSNKYGYAIKIPDHIFDILASQLEHLEKEADRLQVCKLWVQNYPDSFIASKEMGRSYLKSGYKPEAIKYLQAAHHLNPSNSEVNNLLKQLTTD